MALRIAGLKQQVAPVDPEELQETPAQDTPDEEQAEIPDMQEEDLADTQEPDADADDQEGPVSPVTAGYMGPEDGPFMCQNCVFFLGQGACHIVSGQIDPQGCCNLYTPKAEEDAGQNGPSPEEMGAPATSVTPEEPPDEEAPQGA